MVYAHHISQLIFGFCYSLCVARVNDEDQALRVLVVVAPQRSDLVLAADVPYSKTNVFVLHGLHVKTDRRYCGHNLTQLKLVKYSGFSSGVQSNCNNEVCIKASRNHYHTKTMTMA